MMKFILRSRRNALSLRNCKSYKQKVGIASDTDFILAANPANMPAIWLFEFCQAF